MKKFVLIALFTASSLSSLAAYSHGSSSIKACIQEFSAQQFAGHPVRVRIVRDSFRTSVLDWSGYDADVQLVAVSTSTGHNLATATCTYQGGVAKVTSLKPSRLMAAK